MGTMGRNMGRLAGCTCDAWAPDEECPHHGAPWAARDQGPGVCCSPDDRVCPPELCPLTTIR